LTINTEMKVRVAKIAQVADRVKRFRFERADGQPMPIFSGGAHVIVSMRDGDVLRRNPYSLMSSPADTGGYEISVLRVENSRGGSAFLHEKLKEGDSLTLSQPVNLFPYDQRGRAHPHAWRILEGPAVALWRAPREGLLRCGESLHPRRRDR
jgi:ferredoxin-NADP reductase